MISPAVRARWLAFTAPLEGAIAYPYLDILGLVTVAYGVLIDPMSLALNLPFVHAATGEPASRAEIAAGWQRLKGHQELAHQGHVPAQYVTDLRLTAEGIEAVTLSKLDQFAAICEQRFPELATWPDDAQLATLSVAWACGPWIWPRLPGLAHALDVQDWTAAAAECHLDDRHNAGLTPRNAANQALYLSAAQATPTEPETVRELPDDAEG